LAALTRPGTIRGNRGDYSIDLTAIFGALGVDRRSAAVGLLEPPTL
jgi:hypothetical protein